MKQDIKSMTLAELQDAFAALGEPKFRAKQVFAWLHRGAVSFEAMTNLSKTLRESWTASISSPRRPSPASRSPGLTGRLNISGSCVTATASNLSSCSITTAIPSASPRRSAARWAASSARRPSAALSGGWSRRSFLIRCFFSAGFRPADLQHCPDGHRRTIG